LSNYQISILGLIAAGGSVGVFANEAEWGTVNLTRLDYFKRPSRHERSQHFALRVQGDSMVGALIGHGDAVVLRREPNPQTLKNGTIVAARVDTATTIKYFYRPTKDLVVLQPANPAYSEIKVDANTVDIQGVYVGHISGFN
jgi:repressor LexA